MDAATSTPGLPVRPFPPPTTSKRKHDDVSSSDDIDLHGHHDDTVSDFPQFSFEPPMHGIISPFQTTQPPGTDFLAPATVLAPGHPHISDGGSSPRTNVAHRFTSLAIADGRWPREEEEITAGLRGGAMDTTDTAADDAPAKRRRVDLMEDDQGATSDESPPRNVVDPLRASLTWQDDEITVYDPDDADDDGTGVNGIGFKPTPAIAHARALKRRQQLVEYRKREEREARARRSMQRRSRAAAAAAAGSMLARAVKEEAEERKKAESANAEAAETSGTDTRIPSTEEMPNDTGATSGTGTPAESAATSPSPGPEGVRRVRFLETGPTTIRFIEPEPTTIMSS